MSLQTRIATGFTADYSGTLDLAVPDAPLALQKVFTWADGSGLDQANRAWWDTRTIAISGTDDLDLAGVLTDAFGAAITFSRVKAILVLPWLSNVNNVVVGGAPSNAFPLFSDVTDKIPVRPGGQLLIVAPDATAYAVTAGTGDILRIANSGAGSTVTYDIAILGANP